MKNVTKKVLKDIYNFYLKEPDLIGGELLPLSEFDNIKNAIYFDKDRDEIVINFDGGFHYINERIMYYHPLQIFVILMYHGCL